MSVLRLEKRGMDFNYRDSKESKVSDLGNFRLYGVIAAVDSYGLCKRYELEINTHEREKYKSDDLYDTVINTWVDVSTYNAEKQLYCRVPNMCFYCEPTKQALLSEINKRFGMDYTEIEIVQHF